MYSFFVLKQIDQYPILYIIRFLQHFSYNLSILCKLVFAFFKSNLDLLSGAKAAGKGMLAGHQ